MRIVVATIADFANVREGLLNIVSGGVTQVFRSEFPSTMDCTLALLSEVTVVANSELRIPFTITAEDPDGQEIGSVEGEILGSTSGSPDLEIPTYVPLAIPLPFSIPSEGVYTITANVGEAPPVKLVFRGVLAPVPA